ncbi:ketoacyl-ACP synthase III [Alphaproteobacteria bacterium]|nr:ketoacyl-ACP synthase III [Alphaproteobacteria bacterium]
MSSKLPILLTGIGSYLPKKIISNNDLTKFLDTSDEWIAKRTGIKYRHFVEDNELTSDMGTNAAKLAILDAGLKSTDIDLIIVATTTPDNTFPSTASKIQKNLGCKAVSFDVQAVCAGFIYAISIGTSMLKDSHGSKCLIIGSDSMSKILDWKDRSTAVLFGDGAGAVILEKGIVKNKFIDNNQWGILATKIFTDGEHYDLLSTDGGVSKNKSIGLLRMNGKEVFKHAVEKLSSSLLMCLEECNMNINDIDWFIPHQANQRIINAVSNKVKIPHDKIISTISTHGNTSAASIPLALNHAIKKGNINNGDILALQAIGGGLSWGSIILKFGKQS